MKNNFEFYGIKAPDRRVIQRPFLLSAFLPPKSELETIIRSLWSKPQREYQYFAQELLAKYVKQLEKEDIKLLEFLVENKSWWDTVDFIAPKLIGEYFKIYPNQRDIYVNKWLKTENIWLQRSAILFQLKYKNQLDTEVLERVINALLGSNESFINKAIGWILREYSKTNPAWVIEFAKNTSLHKLSRREGLRLI